MRYSIIIPSFNRPDQLSKAISSCLAQTLQDFEVIVIDDASTPSLSACCEDFHDARIRYIRNDRNLGAAESRNRGLALARGDYVSFLDSDDVYLPQRLQKLEENIAKTGSKIVFHLQQRVFSTADGAEVAQVMPSRSPNDGERLDEFTLMNGDYIQTNSYAIWRPLAQKYSFDTTLIAWEDNKYLLECWLDCNQYSVVAEVLSKYFDERRPGRLSKQRDPARHQPFLSFVRAQCSARAATGLQALVDAELPLFQHPIRVTSSLMAGRRAGVSASRCLVYLARSIFGFDRTERLIYGLRKMR